MNLDIKQQPRGHRLFTNHRDMALRLLVSTLLPDAGRVPETGRPSDVGSLPKRPVMDSPERREPIPIPFPTRTIPRLPGILVVDDDIGMRALLSSVLWGQGYAVWLAADGKQALELYRQLEGNIDLVLLDGDMPGMDGRETLAQLQMLRPDIPCCFMTVDCWSCIVDELLQQGVMEVIPKPFRLRELVRIVRGLIGDPSFHEDSEAS